MSQPTTSSDPEPNEAGQRQPGVPSTPWEWVVGTAAFLVELALAGTVAVAAYRLADGGAMGVTAAIVAACALIAVWARWMAPRSHRRLPRAGRLVLGGALVLLAAVAAYISGLPTWAWVFGVIGLLVVGASQT